MSEVLHHIRHGKCVGHLVYHSKEGPCSRQCVWSGKGSDGLQELGTGPDPLHGHLQAREVNLLLAELEFIRVKNQSRIVTCLQQVTHILEVLLNIVRPY